MYPGWPRAMQIRLIWACLPVLGMCHNATPLSCRFLNLLSALGVLPAILNSSRICLHSTQPIFMEWPACGIRPLALGPWQEGREGNLPQAG